MSYAFFRNLSIILIKLFLATSTEKQRSPKKVGGFDSNRSFFNKIPR